MRKIALDTNFMILFVIGSVAPSLIGSQRRVKAFMPDDFELLVEQLENVDLILTPNTLTEVSNLTFEGFHEPYLSRIKSVVFEIISQFSETYVPSKQAAGASEFSWLGLADTVWLEGVNADTTIMTADAKLHVAALKRGLLSINFNHLREEYGTV